METVLPGEGEIREEKRKRREERGERREGTHSPGMFLQGLGEHFPGIEAAASQDEESSVRTSAHNIFS